MNNFFNLSQNTNVKGDKKMAITQTKKRVSGSTIAIIVLSVLLVASIGVGVALAYFTSTANVAGDITLGDPVTISITQGGASASSLTFSGNAMPGSVYDQAIGVSTPAGTSDALVRAKLTITNTDGASTNVEATTTDSWTEGEDGYYYYNGTMAASSNVDFITAITIPTSLTNEDANKTFSITVIVEANNAANAVWTTAPEDWLETYSPAPTTGE